MSRTSRECAVSGCSKTAVRRDWCKGHYNRWRKHGDPGSAELVWGSRPQPVLPRLMARRRIEGECWIFTGALSDQGYGSIRANNREWYVHRLAYELFVGPIPGGLTIDHLCRQRGCFNPAHLEAVTTAENTARGMAPSAVVKRTGICQRGHEFTPENTYIRPDTAVRQCRKCAAYRQRLRRLRMAGSSGGVA